MSKTWMIIKHEYLTNVKRRSFLIGAFVVPLISIVLIGVIFGLVISDETDVTRIGTVGYVDESGVLAQGIDEPDYFRAYESEAAAGAALDEGSIGAYFVVTPNYMNDGMIRAFSKSGLPAALNQDIDSFMVANLSTGLDSTIAARLKDPVEMTVRTLDNGRTIRGSAVAGLFIMPIIFVMVFMIASQTTSGYLMSGVVEEKTNHIMELLVTSVTPFQMMFGKIVGLGLLGLTQLAIWIVAGYITLALGNNSFLAGITIPTDLLVIGVIYFLLGYFLLACVMAAIGVVMGSEQESRQFAGIFGLVLAIPFFAITSFITDPNGAVVTFLTLFPFTSPVSMIMRMGFSAVPAWQLILSIALLLLTSLFMAWASARIFRWALLLYGKRPGVRQLIRVIRRPSGMATSATGERER
ncbi:MAG: ABC transporter permease [Anaerolineae bacterium]|nr:ABC transporter permease [Anaerolineae bacterium]